MCRFEAPFLNNFDGFLVQSSTQSSHHRDMLGTPLDGYHSPYDNGTLKFVLASLVCVVRHGTVEASGSGHSVDTGSRELSIPWFRLRRARGREE